VPTPSADICTIAPNSALCQVLSPPTAAEPVKPVQRATNQVVTTLASAAGESKGGGAGNSATSITPGDDETSDKSAGPAASDKTGKQNDATKKMYCN
jgi:hypothetical protein